MAPETHTSGHPEYLQAARGLAAEHGPRGMVWRHSSLPDLGKVGVLAPLESQVGKLLEYLRDPRTPEEIAGRFPGGDPNAAVKKLMAAGIVFKSEGDEAVFVAKGHVQSMARILEVVGRDLQAFGGYLHRDALAHTGANIVERLERVRGELAAIQNALERRRQPYVAEQLEQLGITSDTRGLKLHLGCRSYLMDGWLNIDIQSAPLRLDMNWGLPFGDGAADYIYTSHVIDHVPYKEPVLGLLRDIHRVLARDGTFRVIVPDVEKCIRAYMLGDLDFFEGRTRRWPLAHYWPWQYCRTKLEHFLGYLGLGVPPHDYVRGHRYAYDFETLSMLLNEAGFSDVRRSEYLGSEDANLRVDDSVKGNMYTHGGLHYAMFVEARKGEVH